MRLSELISLAAAKTTYKRKGNEDSIYIAPLSTHAYSQSDQAWITRTVYLQVTVTRPGNL